MNKKLKLNINAIIQSFNIYTGKINKTSKVHNLVVDTGLDEVIDNGLSNIGFIGLGTDNSAVDSGDTELGTEVAREAVSKTNEGVGIRKYDITFTFNSGESYTITEAGLFNSLIASGSIMFDRLIFSGHDVDVNNGVRVQITITVVNA